VIFTRRKTKMAPLITDVGIFAEEVDHRLEQLAAAARRGEGANTDAQLRESQWFARGIERAREVLREVLNDPVHRAVRRALAAGEPPPAAPAAAAVPSPAECPGSFRTAEVEPGPQGAGSRGVPLTAQCPECGRRLELRSDPPSDAVERLAGVKPGGLHFPRHARK
jgi:hypothetical protein